MRNEGGIDSFQLSCLYFRGLKCQAPLANPFANSNDDSIGYSYISAVYSLSMCNTLRYVISCPFDGLFGQEP
jgi:hypothetical protein